MPADVGGQDDHEGDSMSQKTNEVGILEWLGRIPYASELTRRQRDRLDRAAAVGYLCDLDVDPIDAYVAGVATWTDHLRTSGHFDAFAAWRQTVCVRPAVSVAASAGGADRGAAELRVEVWPDWDASDAHDFGRGGVDPAERDRLVRLSVPALGVVLPMIADEAGRWARAPLVGAWDVAAPPRLEYGPLRLVAHVPLDGAEALAMAVTDRLEAAFSGGVE
jgi:hypothetical protein